MSKVCVFGNPEKSPWAACARECVMSLVFTFCFFVLVGFHPGLPLPPKSDEKKGNLWDKFCYLFGFLLILGPYWVTYRAMVGSRVVPRDDIIGFVDLSGGRRCPKCVFLEILKNRPGLLAPESVL